jgi:hypothetical protein
VIQADGSRPATSLSRPIPRAPIDCFYVYPTVSSDPGGYSDMTPDLPEKAVADQQFARFGQVCKLYAPSYRQVTIAALRKVMMGQASPGDGELAYADVLAGWKDYLARDNHGRGVVLIGHSAGLAHPAAADQGGDRRQAGAEAAGLRADPGHEHARRSGQGRYGSLPLCRKAGQIGCVISYVSFRASSPPPTGSKFFGKVAERA